MKFCYECGNKVVADDKFCPVCGTALQHEEEVTAKSSSYCNNCHARGILLTDTQKLSNIFGCKKLEVDELLRKYVTALRALGVDYHILDCSSYIIKGGHLKDKSVSLSGSNYSIDHYIALINDMYYYGFEPDNTPQFLFIVGNSAVIPMYKGVNYIYLTDSNFSDKDLDSDLPYCYLPPKNCTQLMEQGHILAQQQMLHVGRLAIGNDWQIKDMAQYLSNSVAVQHQGGLSLNSAYGQIDPHWCIESDIVTSQINQRAMFKCNHTLNGFSYNNIHTTPNVTIGNVGSYFNTNSNLLYFNMHGSRFPESSGFIGYGVQDKDSGGTGISPRELASLERSNVLVTEACYGARFEGLPSRNSMLLTALQNKTVCYLGSSRIALAATITDYNYANYISCADVIANGFINSILDGNFAGVAFTEAKMGLLDRLNQLSAQDMLTLAEFNLFGDPTTPINLVDDKSAPVSVNHKGDCSSKIGYSCEEVYSKEQNSLLAMVRGAVDKNIAQIRDTLNNYMAINYGLEPRSLQNITKIKYKNGGETLQFSYSKSEGELNKFFIASTNIKGELQKVLVSKV